MKIQQIRNATIILEYAGKRILVDPMLGEKGSFAPFPLSNHQELRNPLHDLPVKAEVIVSNIDCVLLTHLHLDHIDDAAYAHNLSFPWTEKQEAEHHGDDLVKRDWVHFDGRKK